MRCKVLLLSWVFPPQTGGSGRWFWEMYRRLPREQVYIVTSVHQAQESFDRTHDLRLMRLGYSWKKWGLLEPAAALSYVKALFKVWQIARREDVDLLHCGKLLPEGWIGWLLKLTCRLPYLCYVHGEDLGLGHTSRELRWMMRRVLDGAQMVIANSHNTWRLLNNEWAVPAQRLAVLHPGVEIERFVPAARNMQTRGRLGWHDRPVVLTVGRLQLRKGHDMLIRALPAIRQRVPRVLYSIVGDGEERARLEELARASGVFEHVDFRGEIDDREMIDCYQQCDLFVLPNRHINGDIEGFGMVLLEAQACGKPVVAGASGGTAETMRIPETGRIVPCDGPEELAQIISDLLMDHLLRERMGIAARQWVVDHFSWESVTTRAQELFDRMAPLMRPYWARRRLRDSSVVGGRGP